MKLALPKITLPKLSLPAGLLAKLPPGLAARLGGARDGEREYHRDDPFGPGALDEEEDEEKGPLWRRLLPWGIVGASWFLVVGIGLGFWIWLSANREDIVEDRATSNPAVVLSAQDLAAQFAQQNAQLADAATQHGEAPTQDGGHAAPAASAEGNAEEEAANPPDPFRELMAPHPDRALIETTDAGPLPRIGADGRKAWKVYSRPSNAIEDRPRIALAVLGLGKKKTITERAIDLPGVVSLAFAPGAPGLDDWIADARDAGHEVLLGLPMEPEDFPRDDAGPEALMSALTSEQNLARLKWLMSRGTGYIGFVNTLGGKFLGDATAFRPVAEEMATRGLMFLEASIAPVPSGLDVARKAGLPVVASADWIDATLSRSGIEQALAELETKARSNGQALGLLHPYPVTFGRIRNWIGTLNDKGFAIVPVSALLQGPPS